MRTARRLDREQQDVYVFSVLASNDVRYHDVTMTSRGPAVDVADVTVYIDDVNDHNPVFLFPGPERGEIAYVASSMVNRVSLNDDVLLLNITLIDLSGEKTRQRTIHVCPWIFKFWLYELFPENTKSFNRPFNQPQQTMMCGKSPKVFPTPLKAHFKQHFRLGGAINANDCPVRRSPRLGTELEIGLG